MDRHTSHLFCAGCGWRAPEEDPLPFRCPRSGSGDDVDHVLRRSLEPRRIGSPEEVRGIFLATEDRPLLRYRRLLHSYGVALSYGMSDAEFVELVRRMDEQIDRVAGEDFVASPFAPADDLATRIGLSRECLWVKDETGDISGSHKARHMMGLLLSLEVARRAGLPQGNPNRRLAVASCGNAALAAAEVARAAGRSLEVFVPPDAERKVVELLVHFGAEISVCERRQGETGDPCFSRFREAVAAGALPFTCQGSENGLVIEGGQTLVWEMISRLLPEDRALDHLVVQVGGGALASACIQGLREARALGVLERLPRIHTVQTAGAWPLRRAWDSLVQRILPVADLADRGALARQVAGANAARIENAIRYAATHRSEFMRPWESPPRSIARGILDDETYDWLLVAEGMLETGGVPMVVSEETLREAWDLGVEETGIQVEPTGTAGLAGCLELVRQGEIAFGESVAVLFTGVER